MSVETSPRHGVGYHLVAFDAAGVERPGSQGPASVRLLEQAAGEAPSDIFLFSHGWDADPRKAVAQYGRWVDAMAEREVDRTRLRARAGGFQPLLVGVHWPSRAWADDDLSGMSYDVTAGNGPDESAVGAGSESDMDPVGLLVERNAPLLGEDPQSREALRVIAAGALADAAPPALPPEVIAAYEQLNRSLGLGEAGEGAPPGDDREPFDPEETYQSALLMDIVDPVAFAGFSVGGLLGPLRVLSFWAMKRRALAFGESGAARLLGELRDAAPDARVHVAGHSFGCIVASAAVASARSGGDRRGVDTLVLVQGAMSLWSYCASIPSSPGRAGYFHSIVRDRLVAGPTLVTTSVHDRAVRVFYPLGAGARGQVSYDSQELPRFGAIGAFGLRGPGVATRDLPVRSIDDTFDLEPHVVYNLDCDDVINRASGVSGAHSDINHPEIARAVWRAVEGTSEGRPAGRSMSTCGRRGSEGRPRSRSDGTTGPA